MLLASSRNEWQSHGLNPNFPTPDPADPAFFPTHLLPICKALDATVVIHVPTLSI